MFGFLFNYLHALKYNNYLIIFSLNWLLFKSIFTTLHSNAFFFYFWANFIRSHKEIIYFKYYFPLKSISVIFVKKYFHPNFVWFVSNLIRFYIWYAYSSLSISWYLFRKLLIYSSKLSNIYKVSVFRPLPLGSRWSWEIRCLLNYGNSNFADFDIWK